LLLEPLEERERRALIAECRIRRFQAGEALFHEGDIDHTLYLLRVGWVKILRIAPDGKETILHIVGPGECVGELSAVDGKPRSATAETLGPVEALVLSREAFVAAFQRSPRFALAVSCHLAETVRRVNERVQDGVLLELPGRLAKKLLDLAERYGEPTPDGIRITVRLTQQELAQMVGAGRGRVNECLRGFQKRGLLTVEREQITLHRPDELQQRIY
jgi:CRP/FNR family transcriptional regulator/CRP/FNR family cyclic AMP-dependent transcriptional regulator